MLSGTGQERVAPARVATPLWQSGEATPSLGLDTRTAAGGTFRCPTPFRRPRTQRNQHESTPQAEISPHTKFLILDPEDTDHAKSPYALGGPRERGLGRRRVTQCRFGRRQSAKGPSAAVRDHLAPPQVNYVQTCVLHRRVQRRVRLLGRRFAAVVWRSSPDDFIARGSLCQSTIHFLQSSCEGSSSGSEARSSRSDTQVTSPRGSLRALLLLRLRHAALAAFTSTFFWSAASPTYRAICCARAIRYAIRCSTGCRSAAP